MPHFVKELTVPVSNQELNDWHLRDGAFERLSAPWDDIRHIHADPVANGAKRVFEVRKGGIPIRWVADHENVIPGREFTDVQIQGPFASWRHTHRFEPLSESSSRLVDDVQYKLPMGSLGAALAGRSIEKDISNMFDFRHRATLGDLTQHVKIQKRYRVGVTGASGLIGKQLVAFLRTGGHEVLRFVRHTPAPEKDEIRWSVEEGVIDLDRMEKLDVIVHLAGANVAQRWNTESKREILESRVLGTRAIVDAIAKLSEKPEVFIGASAVGYYGDTAEATVDESAPVGTGFLAEVCDAWEAETQKAKAYCRTVIARIGVVMDPRGGALEKLLPVTLAGVGGPVGDGKQKVSWIGLDDVLGALITLIDNTTATGAYNLTGPQPASQLELAQTLGRVMSRPAFAPAPAAAIKLLYGEMGVATVLASTGACPRRLEALEYTFRAPTLEGALRHCLGRL